MQIVQNLNIFHAELSSNFESKFSIEVTHIFCQNDVELTQEWVFSVVVSPQRENNVDKF